MPIPGHWLSLLSLFRTASYKPASKGLLSHEIFLAGPLRPLALRSAFPISQCLSTVSCYLGRRPMAHNCVTLRCINESQLPCTSLGHHLRGSRHGIHNKQTYGATQSLQVPWTARKNPCGETCIPLPVKKKTKINIASGTLKCGISSISAAMIYFMGSCCYIMDFCSPS